jgi:hypothetical protein
VTILMNDSMAVSLIPIARCIPRLFESYLRALTVRKELLLSHDLQIPRLCLSFPFREDMLPQKRDRFRSLPNASSLMNKPDSQEFTLSTDSFNGKSMGFSF